MDTRNAREVTLRLPHDLAAQVDQVIAQRVRRAALDGQIGRGLPTRHAFLLEAVRAALAAERDRSTGSTNP